MEIKRVQPLYFKEYSIKIIFLEEDEDSESIFTTSFIFSHYLISTGKTTDCPFSFPTI